MLFHSLCVRPTLGFRCDTDVVRTLLRKPASSAGCWKVRGERQTVSAPRFDRGYVMASSLKSMSLQRMRSGLHAQG